MKIRGVYDEMELQIKNEEKRLISEVSFEFYFSLLYLDCHSTQEKQRQKQMQADLEHDLREKDRHYKELVAKHEHVHTCF